MLRLIIPRITQLFVICVVVSTLCFALMQCLPGDPAMRIAAGRYGPDAMSANAAEQVRQELGLNAPLLQQYWQSLKQLGQGDLGYSLVTGESVLNAIQHELGHTLVLAGSAWLLAIVIAFPVGLISGWRPKGLVDQTFLLLSVVFRAVPPFIVAVCFMWLFSYYLGWLPAAGAGDAVHLVLPSLTLATSLAAVSNRVFRNAVVDVKQQSYFLFARLKGLKTQPLIRLHLLRNAAIPLVTYLSVQLIYLIEGVVVVESLFAYPGIGHALVHAIIDRDVPMLQGTVLVMSVLFVLISTGTDALIYWLNPRQGAIYAK